MTVEHFKSEDQITSYFDSIGFKVERVELLPSDWQLYSYKNLTGVQIEKVKGLLGKKYLWVITLKN